MTSKSYVSGSHANWENIQLDSFTGWINQQLHERNLVVKDLATDFSDGVMLINLLEIISGKKIPRYVRNPKFLQHKIDNIMVALLFMEKILDIKVVGCNAKDIVDGNLKQIMGVSFLLIQKVKTNMQLELDPTLVNAMGGLSASKRATIIGTPVSRFAHKSLNQEASNTTADTSSSAASSTELTSQKSDSPSSINGNKTPVETGSVAVSTLRNRFASLPATRPSPIDISSSPSTATNSTSVASSNAAHTTPTKSTNQLQSSTSSSPSSDIKSDRVLIRKTKSGAILCGTFEFGGKQHSLRKLVCVQAHIRGWLARRRIRAQVEKRRQLMKMYEDHFATNKKAYRGLTLVQARIKGRMERKRLWRQYPLFRRNDIVKEILATERKYVRCLEILIEIYLRECEKILTPIQVKSIFSQIEVIKNVNFNLLTQMENRFKEGSKQQLGEIFKRTTDYLKVYTNYVNNYNTSIATINECKENEKFVKLLETNRLLDKCMGLDLSAFLIMPIQRLPRYVLLLQDLVKYTGEEHSDYENLSVALKKMKDVAEYVNEKKREAENLNQVLSIQNSLVGKENLAEPHRRYVRKGPLTCLDERSNPRIFFFFLFNDILLKTENKNLAKQLSQSKNPRATLTGADEGKFKYIVSYHLDGASLIDLPDTSTNQYSFQLIGLNTGTLTESGSVNTAITLTASSLGEKMIWINDIDDSISQLLEKARSKKRSLITDYDELSSAPYEAPIKDHEMSGILTKQHSEILWKQKQFYLKNGNLYYNTIDENLEKPKKMKCINLILSSVKLVQVVDHPHCFQLITPLRIYFFSCPDGQSLFLWISLIRASIYKKLESLTEVDEAQENSDVQTCSDCGAPNPSWVSTTFNVILCVECSGVHRHLPNGASQVKSMRGLSTSQFDLEHLLESNSRVNQRYEKNVPHHITKPNPDSSVEIRLPWIYAKYLPNTAIPSSPSEVRRASVKMNSSAPPQLSASLTGSVGRLDHFMDLGQSKKDQSHTTPVTGDQPVNSTNNNEISTTTTTTNQSPNNNNEQSNDSLTTESSTLTNNTNEDSATSLGTSIENSTSSSLTGTPNSLVSVDANAETSTLLLSSSPVNGSSISVAASDDAVSSPTSGVTSPANSSSWKGHQAPTIERKKSVFLDKPRGQNEVVKKEIDGILLKTSNPSKSSNWKKYHFFYKDGLLNYYKTDDKKMKKPRGIIDLRDFYSLRQDPVPKQQFSFTLITKYRLFFFGCDSAEQLRAWCEVLSVDSKVSI